MICAGIDAGSRAIKIVLMRKRDLQVVESGVRDQGINQDSLVMQLFDRVLEDKGLSHKDIGTVVATGYGRNNVSRADKTITEITCQARGVRHEMPEARSVIDIGGQDSKLIHLDSDGSVRDFVMNDRCASGTGCFLEVVAERLNVPINELGEKGRQSAGPVPISSTCVVFAETEIIGLLARGEQPENIIAGVEAAIATRIAVMAGRNISEPIVFTGGVAMIPGMDTMLETALGRPVSVAMRPQFTCALGAAILATGI